MLILTVQTKGGSGKSTSSQQLLATYFIANDMPVTLVEIDDENLDSAYLTQSAIKTEQIPLGASADASRIIEQLMERINENIVIDVGGNRTATNFIEAAGRSGFLSMIDIIVVPISSPGQDEVNALRTIKLIRKEAPDAKVVIVVTRQMVGSDEEFSSVFDRYFDRDELTEVSDGIMYFPQVMAMVHSRQLNMSLYEMAIQKDAIAAGLSKSMLEEQKKGNPKRAIHWSRIRSSVCESADVLKFIEQCHSRLDQLIKA